MGNKSKSKNKKLKRKILIEKNQEKQKVYIDLYHHQNCEREKYLTTKILLVKNEKHVIIIVKKQTSYNLFVKNILHSWRQTRLCTINLLFSMKRDTVITVPRIRNRLV